jgi:hypothetical protein
MRLLIPGHMDERFAILIEGVNDTTLATDIERTIRESLQEMVLPGAWGVTVKPSPVHGRWNFTFRSRGVRHTMAISVPPSLLPSLIPCRFRESLNRFRIAPSGRVRMEQSILRAV